MKDQERVATQKVTMSMTEAFFSYLSLSVPESLVIRRSMSSDVQVASSTSTMTIARAALRRTKPAARAIPLPTLNLPRRALTASSRADDNLNPSVPTTPLGLPVEPLPNPIPTIPPTQLDRTTLHKLCTLAALDPPAEGSEAETKLLSELGELVGLMDLVGTVELESDVSSLLSQGVGEYVLGQERDRESIPDGKENGRQLLEYATRRVGDYYGFRADKGRQGE